MLYHTDATRQLATCNPPPAPCNRQSQIGSLQSASPPYPRGISGDFNQIPWGLPGDSVGRDYSLDKSSLFPYAWFMDAKPHRFLGLAADADALSVRRMSRLIEASSILVGTRFSCSRFCFLFMRGVL